MCLLGGRKRIRTAVAAFAELSLATRPSDHGIAKVNQKLIVSNHHKKLSFLNSLSKTTFLGKFYPGNVTHINHWLKHNKLFISCIFVATVWKKPLFSPQVGK